MSQTEPGAADADHKTANMTCEHCWFFYTRGPRTEQCRRYPPKFVNGQEAWPFVRGDDWCGEFKRNE